MAGYLLGRPSWGDWGLFPVKERFLDGFDTEKEDAVLLIEVAGGMGPLAKKMQPPGRCSRLAGPILIGELKALPAKASFSQGASVNAGRLGPGLGRSMDHPEQLGGSCNGLVATLAPGLGDPVSFGQEARFGPLRLIRGFGQLEQKPRQLATAW